MSGDTTGWFSSAFERRRVGVGALVTTQTGDFVTTLYGLRWQDAVELNPIVAAAIANLGVVIGLLCTAALAVLAVVLVTETAVWRYEGPVLTAGRVRCVGYLPHASLSGAATLNNLFVIGVL